jgi:hypothetical protein
MVALDGWTWGDGPIEIYLQLDLAPRMREIWEKQAPLDKTLSVPGSLDK